MNWLALVVIGFPWGPVPAERDVRSPAECYMRLGYAIHQSRLHGGRTGRAEPILLAKCVRKPLSRETRT